MAMDEGSSNMLHYGFSSLDEEIAKDQMDAEHAFVSGSAALGNASSAQDVVLQNVDPSVILDISGAAQQEVMVSEPQPSSSHVAAGLSASAPVGAALPMSAERKPRAPNRSRKRKAGKAMKDENAPKLPQTGYVMFMNERRDGIKAGNPHISFSDLTKTIAAEWSGMDPKQKKGYLEMADENKAKYLVELTIYQQTETFKSFQNKKQQAGSGGGPKPKQAASASNQQIREPIGPVRMPGMDIPIFTETFLDHNKNREKELRELRKLNTQYEEQNAILSKHVEDLKGLVTGLQEEAQIQRNNNMALVQHLESLRATLANNFVGISLPGEDGDAIEATEATIDSYMSKLHHIILESPQDNQELIFAVREVVNKLNLEAYVT